VKKKCKFVFFANKNIINRWVCGFCTPRFELTELSWLSINYKLKKFNKNWIRNTYLKIISNIFRQLLHSRCSLITVLLDRGVVDVLKKKMIIIRNPSSWQTVEKRITTIAFRSGLRHIFVLSRRGRRRTYIYNFFL